MESPPELVTIRELALRWGIRQRTMRLFLKNLGPQPFMHRRGKGVLIDASAFRVWNRERAERGNSGWD